MVISRWIHRVAIRYVAVNPGILAYFPRVASTAFSYDIQQQQRCFAKQIDRGGTKKVRGNITDSAITDLINLDAVRDEMKQVIDLLRDDYVQQLSIRTNLQTFERVIVKLPDKTEVPLNHLAQVTFKNPQTAIIDCTASAHAVRSVADALIQNGLCGNPQIQTTTIYVPLQKPSRDHREKLAQNAKLLYNRCHERLRAVDRKYQLQLRQFEQTAPRDTYRNAQMVLHDLVKTYARQAEEMMKSKQTELMEEIK